MSHLNLQSKRDIFRRGISWNYCPGKKQTKGICPVCRIFFLISNREEPLVFWPGRGSWTACLSAGWEGEDKEAPSLHHRPPKTSHAPSTFYLEPSEPPWWFGKTGSSLQDGHLSGLPWAEARGALWQQAQTQFLSEYLLKPVVHSWFPTLPFSVMCMFSLFSNSSFNRKRQT